MTTLQVIGVIALMALGVLLIWSQYLEQVEKYKKRK
jgi:hypothetical protein